MGQASFSMGFKLCQTRTCRQRLCALLDPALAAPAASETPSQRDSWVVAAAADGLGARAAGVGSTAAAGFLMSAVAASRHMDEDQSSHSTVICVCACSQSICTPATTVGTDLILLGNLFLYIGKVLYIGSLHWKGLFFIARQS